jgi:hypothetical protein
MTGHYVWLVWSSAFLVPWLLLFLAFERHRRQMWWTSLLMIYAAIAAMIAGAVAVAWCRPDLKPNALAGGMLFLAIYTVFLLGLKWSVPGYIEQVWNLEALSGILIYGLPIEELLFGFAFGLVWTGMYEHFTSKRGVSFA